MKEFSIIEWFEKNLPDRRVILKKGGILFHQGDSSEYLYLVRQGCIVMIKESPFGNPFITERLLVNEFLGSFAIMGEFPYPTTAQAESPSVVEGFYGDKVRTALLSDDSFRRSFFREVGMRIQEFQSRLMISPERVKIRLARVILSLCKKNLNMELSFMDKNPVSLDVTRQSLSLMAGTSVETAIRLTRLWEKEGVLDLSKRGRVQVLSLDYFMNLTYEKWKIEKE